MGIYDRHYVRDAPPQRGGFLGPQGILNQVRMWSVTTWLIVICVAVFVIDGFLPVVFVPTNNVFPPEMGELEGTALTMVPTLLPAAPQGANPQITNLWCPLIEKSTGIPRAAREIIPMRLLEAQLHFSTGMLLLPRPGDHFFPRMEFWRLIGFQFLHSHAGITHLLFNMLGLFFFGPMVEEHLGSKRYLAFYLLCGIFGALMYMLLNLAGYVVANIAQQQVTIPGLLFNDPFTPLVGASAGVIGVLMAGAFIAPRTQVFLFFVLPIQLRTLAYALAALAVYSVLTGGHNAGGEAGHLGGALAGYYFIRRPHHLHGFFDFLGRADPTSHHYRKRKGRRVPSASVTRPSRVDIDRILDKIQREGMSSLTDQEKRILSDASRSGP